jgi:excisionase family DNA binding protein
MQKLKDLNRPSKQDQQVAMESYSTLAETLKQIRSDNPEIEIEETGQKLRVPISALELLASILEATSQGKSVTVMPIATQMTTQAAAEFLGCSRPHLVKLLEEGKIPFTLVGRHRRVLFDDLLAYNEKKKKEQRERLIEMMRGDEELGLYDS